MNETKHRQENGVILTLRNTPDGKTDCVDIDIPDGIHTLVLGTEFGKISYRLRNVLKSFPDIEKLRILDTVGEIEISNFMFPRVKNVESENPNYISGKVLCKRKAISSFRSERKLLNVFCDQNLKDLDLAEISAYNLLTIANYAMEGCFVESTIQRGNLIIEENSFKGSSFYLKPSEDGIIKAGTTIIGFDASTGKLYFNPELSKETNKVLVNMEDDVHFEEIIISNIHQLSLIPSKISAEVLTILDRTVFNPKKIKLNIQKIKIQNHPYYQEKDGVLYSKDWKSLIKFPKGRSGHFSVPEGTEEIGDKAFEDSNLSSVSFPDSLRYIGDAAFQKSKLQHVNFGNGIKHIGGYSSTKVFFGCTSLKEIEIPSSVSLICENAFMDCASLEKVILNEGLIEIGNYAFLSCDKLKTITIPSSVRFLGQISLSGILNIHLKKDSVPKGFIDAIAYPSQNTNRAVRYNQNMIHLYAPNGKDIFLPLAINSDQFSELNKISYLSEIDPDSAPDMACDDRMKQDIIIGMWNSFENDKKREEYGQILHRSGKKICLRLIEEGKEDLIIKFAETRLLTRFAINDILNVLPDSMVSAKAKLLGMSSKNTKRKIGL